MAEEKAKEAAEIKAKEEAAKAAAEDGGDEADAEEPKEKGPEDQEDDNQENEENEEEQEEKEVIPDPPQTECKYVISMDTLGDAQQYDDQMVQWVDESITKLEETLMGIDIKEFMKQREHSTEITAKLVEYTETMKAEIDAKVQEIETENEANPEEIKNFKKKA